jgi:hypothetical protein
MVLGPQKPGESFGLGQSSHRKLCSKTLTLSPFIHVHWCVEPERGTADTKRSSEIRGQQRQNLAVTHKHPHPSRSTSALFASVWPRWGEGAAGVCGWQGLGKEW